MVYYKKALYSRIYNKIKFDPIEKFAFVVTLCIATLFSFFSCVSCYASDSESVSYDIVSGIYIAPNSNYFVTNTSASTGYFQLEKGYIYTITCSTNTANLRLATSNEIPEANGTYNYLTTIGSSSDTYSYSYIVNDSNSYLYFDFSWATTGINVTREKIANYEGAVTDLVDNVGVNQIWSVFEDGTSFIGVVVLVAFGLFLVVLAINKVSKGKSEF